MCVRGCGCERRAALHSSERAAAMDLLQLCQCLQQCMSTDEGVRRQAEGVLKQVRACKGEHDASWRRCWRPGGRIRVARASVCALRSTRACPGSS